MRGFGCCPATPWCQWELLVPLRGCGGDDALLLYPGVVDNHEPTTPFLLEQGFGVHLEVSGTAKKFPGLQGVSSSAEHRS